jgi:proteasome lid subunit RPN8/RPN11
MQRLDGFPVDSNVLRSAEQIWQRLHEGGRTLRINVALPDRKSLPLIIKRRALRSGLRISLDRDFPRCQECRNEVKRIPGVAKNIARLSEVLQQAVKALNCNCAANSPEPGGTPPEPELRPLRIRPDASASRVRIVPPDQNAPSTERVIRVTNSRSITVLNETQDNKKFDRQNQTHQSHAYAVPSLRYNLDSKVRVEITIPRHVCDALVGHCGDSNRHKREVGGILVGHHYEKEDEQTADRSHKEVVTDIIPFKSSDSSGAHLRLDENSWVHVQQIFETNYAPENKVRLGWYHTHPTQGIFFSPQDRDAHTVFKMPHQFALVVDPRRMEAGLFYWEDYDKRYLSEPIVFSLKRQSGPDGDRGDRVTTNHMETDPLCPLSWLRVIGFFALIVGLIIYVMLETSPSGIRPIYACLLAFSAFLGLRLMNARFFRPSEPIEAPLITAVCNVISVTIDKYFSGVVEKVLLGVMGVIIVLLGVLVWDVLTRSAPSSSLVQIPPSANKENGSPSQTDHDQILHLKIEQVSAGKKIILSSIEPKIVVTFLSKPPGSWQPVDAEKEQEFFSKVFNVEISENQTSDSLQALQRSLFGKALKGEDKYADGKWGVQARSLFLSGLLRLKESKGSFVVPQPNNRQWSIVVE